MPTQVPESVTYVVGRIRNLCARKHIRHLRRSSRPHDRQCGRLAGGDVTDLLRRREQIADVFRGVVRRHVSGLVPEQELSNPPTLSSSVSVSAS